MRFKWILLAAIGASIGLVSDASAAASKCKRSSAKAGSVVLVRTSSAVVFGRRRTNKVWACRLKGSRIYRLPADSDGYVEQSDRSALAVHDPQIAGRFVGYVLTIVPDNQAAVDSIRVLDLKTGKLRVNARAHSLRRVGGISVSSFVLNRNGAIAWIATGAEGFRAEGIPTIEVHRVTSTDPTRSDILDSAIQPPAGVGPIPARSLALSADASTVYWLHDGQPRSASLT